MSDRGHWERHTTTPQEGHSALSGLSHWPGDSALCPQRNFFIKSPIASSSATWTSLVRRFSSSRIGFLDRSRPRIWHGLQNLGGGPEDRLHVENGEEISFQPSKSNSCWPVGRTPGVLQKMSRFCNGDTALRPTSNLQRAQFRLSPIVLCRLCPGAGRIFPCGRSAFSG